MIYERMKYANERREWVRAADEQLPGLIEEAGARQRCAANYFASWQALSPAQKLRCSWMQSAISDEYRYAHNALYRVLYYEGMRRANMDEPS